MPRSFCDGRLAADVWCFLCIDCCQNLASCRVGLRLLGFSPDAIFETNVGSRLPAHKLSQDGMKATIIHHALVHTFTRTTTRHDDTERHVTHIIFQPHHTWYHGAWAAVGRERAGNGVRARAGITLVYTSFGAGCAARAGVCSVISGIYGVATVPRQLYVRHERAFSISAVNLLRSRRRDEVGT